MNENTEFVQEVLDNRKVFLLRSIDYFTPNKIDLPYLTDDELLARYKRIKPIVLIHDAYYYLKRYDVNFLRTASFLWNAEQDKRRKVNMTDAETLGDFSCYHTYGYVGFFKPTIAEVLQQFPDEFLDDANAFYITDYPKCADDLNRQKEIIDAGCQKSIVRALKLKVEKK